MRKFEEVKFFASDMKTVPNAINLFENFKYYQNLLHLRVSKKKKTF